MCMYDNLITTVYIPGCDTILRRSKPAVTYIMLPLFLGGKT